MLGQRPTSINFERRLNFEDETIKLTDKIWLKGKETVESLSVGGGFTVRYVPQSRYFQDLELIDHSNTINPDKLRELNEEKHLELSKTVPWKSLQVGEASYVSRKLYDPIDHLSLNTGGQAVPKMAISKNDWCLYGWTYLSEDLAG